MLTLAAMGVLAALFIGGLVFLARRREDGD
jgi:hypothetical protein